LAAPVLKNVYSWNFFPWWHDDSVDMMIFLTVTYSPNSGVSLWSFIFQLRNRDLWNVEFVGLLALETLIGRM
jgi:hypothetical protein